MTEISEEIQTSEEDEKKMYADFKRKLNLEAASAQVAKLEFNLTQATVSKAELRRACQEANRLHLGAVCVLPNQVKHCVHFLGNDPPDFAGRVHFVSARRRYDKSKSCGGENGREGRCGRGGGYRTRFADKGRELELCKTRV